MAMMRHKVIDALAKLASDPDAQVCFLEGLGLPGYEKPSGRDLRNIDELALDFNDAIISADTLRNCGEFTERELECLLSLDSLIDNMSGETHAQLWTVEALYASPEWQVVRRTAQTCLDRCKNTT
jgi:hypothetical protein